MLRSKFPNPQLQIVAQYVGYDGSKVLSGCKGLYRAFKLTAYNVRAGVLGVYCCISIRELPKIGDPYIVP